MEVFGSLGHESWLRAMSPVGDDVSLQGSNTDPNTESPSRHSIPPPCEEGGVIDRVGLKHGPPHAATSPLRAASAAISHACWSSGRGALRALRPKLGRHLPTALCPLPR